ncbi:MAG: hypothetical protein KIT45_00430 [Fimbriimonadia bacterium]|nr:hypothetical protein [Fimbriimonadia bacterium]
MLKTDASASLGMTKQIESAHTVSLSVAEGSASQTLVSAQKEQKLPSPNFPPYSLT